MGNVDEHISNISSVIKQKGEPQNGGSKKIKQAKFSEKKAFLNERFLSPDTHTYVHKAGGKRYFSENLAHFVFCFLAYPYGVLLAIFHAKLAGSDGHFFKHIRHNKK